MDTLMLVSAFAISILIATGFTFAVRNAARRRGWVLFPASHHIHKKGIPRLGGTAVFSTFILLFAVGAATGADPSWRQQVPVILPASLLFLVGLIDDIWGLSARVKLACQIGGGVCLFAVQGAISQSYPLPIHGLPVNLGLALSLLGTVVWVVLVTNAFNLIDGLDGLAAGATLFALITLCVLAVADRNMGVVYATMILGGAVLGFLRFNFNPASIFMGDSGSLFLGFMLSGFALMPRHTAAPALVAVTIPLLSFGVPIVETGLSIVRRFLSGKPLFAPDRDHIHHRLLKLGLSHRQAVLVLYGACASCSLVSLFLLYPGRRMVGLVLMVSAILFVFGIQGLGYQEFHEIARLFHRWFTQKQVIANNIAIRKTVQALKECNSWPEVAKTLDGLLKIGEFDSYSLTVTDEYTVRRSCRDGKIVDKTLMDELSEDGFGVRMSSAWSFGVDLPVRGKQPLGHFKIGRMNCTGNLRMDINLLLNEVQPALGETCDRLCPQHVPHRGLELVAGGFHRAEGAFAAAPSAVMYSFYQTREAGRKESGIRT